MSGLKDLEKKIDGSNTKIDKLIDVMTDLLKFQARAEVMHETSSKRLEKVESKVDKLWDMVHKNSLIVNGAVGLLCLITGSTVSMFLGD